MKKEEIIVKLTKVFSDNHKNIKSITLKTNLKKIGVDSLDLITYVIEIEKIFNLKIEDSELLDLNLVEDIVNLISNKLK